MARLDPGFSDEEFVGYTFCGVPERRPRLWFLDRDLFTLMLWEQHLMAEGRWTVRPDQIRQLDKTWPADKALWEPESIGAALPGIHLRYEYGGPATGFPGVKLWSAVWMLTETVIEHVETFGFDDVWRLGVWPD